MHILTVIRCSGEFKMDNMSCLCLKTKCDAVNSSCFWIFFFFSFLFKQGLNILVSTGLLIGGDWSDDQAGGSCHFCSLCSEVMKKLFIGAIVLVELRELVE